MTTIDQHLAKAADYFDEVIAPRALEGAVEMIRAHGDPTEEEFAEYMRCREQDLQEARADFLTKLREWLQRDGQTLQ